jgi:hypothetical protein
MPTSTPQPLKGLKLPVRIVEGTRGRLDFDYSCGRGHSFGEYHVHGVVNEILCSAIDPMRHRVRPGFPHAALQTARAAGRRREVDFAVEMLGQGIHAFYAEVKWAGSSHCSQENVLRDLCRLQLIRNLEPTAECVFVLAGALGDVDALFRSGILASGTSGPLHRRGAGNRLAEGGPRRRTKNFSLVDNADHAEALAKLSVKLSGSLPLVPERLCTHLVHAARSGAGEGRFQTLVWSVDPAASGTT